MCAAALSRLKSFKPLEPLERRVLFAAGDLDALFAGGKVTRDFKGNNDFGFAVVVQADGKVLVAGQAFVGSTTGNDFAVARFNVDGTPDTTFGVGGIVTTDMGSASDGSSAMLVQVDGKIVVAGSTTRTGTSSDFAVVRYNSNGTIDTSFGTAGKVVTDINATSDQAAAMAFGSGGCVVVAGWTTISGLPQFAMVRYTTSGGLDSTFGSAGKVTTSYANGYSRGQGVAIQADGRIVLAGGAINLSDGASDFAAVRYLTTGQIDSTFGNNGWATLDLGGDATAHAVLIQVDGKIVLAGEYNNWDTGASDFAVARLTSGGAPDTAFGTGGSTLTDFAGDYDQGTAAALQTDGKIVVAGAATDALGNMKFGLARYTTTGALDASFASGKVFIQFGISDVANAVAIDGQGRLVVAGFNTSAAGKNDFAVARVIGKINVAPISNPGGSYSVLAGGSVQLDGSASYDSDGIIVTYEWDMNYNGVTFDADATGNKPTFNAAGLSGPATRKIALRVTDENGAKTIATTTVSILKPIIPPTANPGSGYTVTAGSSIQLDGTGSSDADGVVVNYQWDFDYDGQTFDVNATGATPAFSAAGLAGPTSRTVALRVTDDDGATGLATATVTVLKLIVAPVASAGGSYSVTAGASIQLDGSGSFDSDGHIVSYEWDLDYDGQTFGVDATGVTPTFSAAGLTGPATRIVALRVTDDDGATSIATSSVSILKLIVPPTANPGSGYTVMAGSLAQLDGSASVDPDGQIVSYEWDFNYDGQSFDVDASGAIPTFSAAGLSGPSTRTIALRVTDDDGASSIATTTITIQPTPFVPPTADPGSGYVVKKEYSIQLDGSGSSDPDGTIVSYEWDFDYDGQGFNVDATGVSPTFSAEEIKAGGVRTVALRVTDNDGLSSIATTTVNIVASRRLHSVEVLPATGKGEQPVLAVYGTDGSDRIFIHSCKDKVEIRLDGQFMGRFAGIGRIVAYGDGGNDFINAHGTDVPVDLFGGKGNDVLIGGRMNDILSGGDGNDLLFGGRGDDVLVGGAGKNKLHSHFGKDVQIDSSVSGEDDDDQLRSLLATQNKKPPTVVETVEKKRK